MIDKSNLLKSQGSLYLEFIPNEGLFHKMFLWDLKLVDVTLNYTVLCDFARISHFLPKNETK